MRKWVWFCISCVAIFVVTRGAFANTENMLRDVPEVASHHLKLHVNYIDPLNPNPEFRSLDIPGFGSVTGLFLYSVNHKSPTLIPPTIKFERGEKYNIKLSNEMDNLLDSVPVEMNMGKMSVPLQDTNLHLHGLIVSPCNPKGKDIDQHSKCKLNYNSMYGDYVLVTLKPKNAIPTTSNHAAHYISDSAVTPIEHNQITYHYEIPKDHPDGLSWYHPHIHGTSASQVGGGLAGMITIGKLWDYAYINCHKDPKTKKWTDKSGVACDSQKIKLEKHDRTSTKLKTLLLKDFQVKSEQNHWRYDLSDPTKISWCGASPTEDARQPGTCSSEGIYQNGSNKGKPYNHKWLFTVNGQLVPTISVKSGTHDVWRIANMSANVTHDLELQINDTNTLIPMKLLSQDGVTRKVADSFSNIVMTPAVRVEVLVDAQAVCDSLKISPCKLEHPIKATLKTKGKHTGADSETGDTWPAMTLATVTFESTRKGWGEHGLKFNLASIGNAHHSSLSSQNKLADTPQKPSSNSLVEDANPRTISPSQFRLIGLYNGSKDGNEFFGMAKDGVYDIPKKEGNADWAKLPNPKIDIGKYASFNLANELTIEADVSQNGGYKEIWVIKNDSKELHNFHLHQTKFEVLHSSLKEDKVASPILGGANQLFSIVGDYAFEKGKGNSNSNGADKVDVYPIEPDQWIAIRVTFDHEEQLGRYVYHCHILEHEDKGMMSIINVIRPPN